MILSVGEILVDMIGGEKDGVFCYERKAGGAPFNVACAAAKFGAKSGFVGCVGEDTVGTFLEKFVNEWARENNYKYELNQFFTYNTLGVGKYVNIFDLNNNNNLYFETNKFYPISFDNYQKIFDFYNEQNNTSILTGINIGYVLIDIPFSDSFITELQKMKDENIYFCTSLNSEKLPLNEYYLYNFDTTKKYSYILFYKCYLIPEKIKSEIIHLFYDIFLSYPLKYVSYNNYPTVLKNEIMSCEYYPMYQMGNVTLKNIFVPTKIYDSGDIYYKINDKQPENLIVFDALNLTKKIGEKNAK